MSHEPQGLLPTYRALLEKKPKAKFKSFDELLQVESEGRLAARVAEMSTA